MSNMNRRIGPNINCKFFLCCSEKVYLQHSDSSKPHNLIINFKYLCTEIDAIDKIPLDITESACIEKIF